MFQAGHSSATCSSMSDRTVRGLIMSNRVKVPNMADWAFFSTVVKK